MHSVVKKWGNSLGIRIPAKSAHKLGLTEGSAIDIATKKDSLIIKKEDDELQILLNQVTSKNKHTSHDDYEFVGKENIDE
ncbi:AbrB/MazE/SpoVT family DNA-binding domain-containing protein [Thiotrichales bacterium 19S3-7]|nr:AbrB/MazE/SpoVT family DNA-binding domain-containing protein [Thiotrichales bacterium 19S3-7]MCF6801980.1 AbrB/MazE/SpoVT family DNA-binding domain-containing protein [Thiotrichales bacterium 19S3-11]